MLSKTQKSKLKQQRKQKCSSHLRNIPATILDTANEDRKCGYYSPATTRWGRDAAPLDEDPRAREPRDLWANKGLGNAPLLWCFDEWHAVKMDGVAK